MVVLGTNQHLTEGLPKSHEDLLQNTKRSTIFYASPFKIMFGQLEGNRSQIPVTHIQPVLGQI